MRASVGNMAIGKQANQRGPVAASVLALNDAALAEGFSLATAANRRNRGAPRGYCVTLPNPGAEARRYNRYPGGGQLGRMIDLAARARHALKCFSPDPDFLRLSRGPSARPAPNMRTSRRLSCRGGTWTSSPTSSRISVRKTANDLAARGRCCPIRRLLEVTKEPAGRKEGLRRRLGIATGKLRGGGGGGMCRVFFFRWRRCGRRCQA